jgi:hypothetical protein
MRVDVHARRIEPDEERLIGFGVLVDEAIAALRNSSSTVSMRFLVK